jgi:transcriptional regulator of acetoin/glycerol metabolism
MVVRALSEAHGNVSAAARILQVDRMALVRLMRKHKVTQ